MVVLSWQQQQQQRAEAAADRTFCLSSESRRRTLSERDILPQCDLSESLSHCALCSSRVALIYSRSGNM